MHHSRQVVNHNSREINSRCPGCLNTLLNPLSSCAQPISDKLNLVRFLAILLALPLAAQLRPPATPLITHDPYFSIWSMSDHPARQFTKHWTGSDQQLTGLVRVDNKVWRFLGSHYEQVPALPLASREVTPTRTVYRFEDSGFRFELTFLTPAFLDDLDVLSRPVTYIRFRSNRPAQVWLDASAVLAVNTPDQSVVATRIQARGFSAVRAGSQTQALLSRAGDNLRIDWGWLYLVAPSGSVWVTRGPQRAAFVDKGALPDFDDVDFPRPAMPRNAPLLAATLSLDADQPKEAIIAYDDGFSIQYLQRNLRPWWRRNGMSPIELLEAALHDSPALWTKSERYDADLRARLEKAGGPRYADIAALAYRQAIAAHKMVADIDGSLYYFSKENFSNGCIATVDVTYPSAPLFLALQPRLLRGMIAPMLQYAALPRWRFPFAPHDLGTYPLANGQVYGGGELTEENQMPVEESGNLLILTAALKDDELARKYWPQLTRWAAYLKEKGLDPENQLSTDDFAGHLAHNTNLSIKAILALGAYARMAERLNDPAAAAYLADAKRMAQQWVKMAGDGDHYRLAFDKPGTWSQKYNLVWDRILGLNLFSPEVARKEIAFYKTVQKPYGLPLDNRKTYTKLDWIIWTATLAESRADFDALVDPVWKFLNESPSRVPMTDWYETTDAKQVGFQARSVVGGVFIPLLR